MSGTNWLNTFEIPSYAAPIDPDAPLGSVLHSQVSTLNGQPVSFNCGSAPGHLGSTLYGRLTPTGAYSTWPTSIDGIGVRLRYINEDRWWPIYTAMEGQGALISFMPHNAIIEFVKTGPIRLAGGNLSGELAGIWIRYNTQQVVSYRISGAIQVKPRPPTCVVTTKTIPLEFGAMPLHTFPANVGEATPEKPFNISVRCSGAGTGGKAHVYITLTDAANSGNRSDQLTLSPSTGGVPKASGVAPQILNAGRPVKFGPDSSAPGNPNQWFVRETGNGVFDIPLTARYLRTAAPLKAGSANAVATFTMSYQ